MDTSYLEDLIAGLRDRIGSLENEVDELKKLIPDKLIKRLKEVEEKADDSASEIDDIKSSIDDLK